MKHLERELEALKRKILDMGSLVEAALEAAVDALLQRSTSAAQAVVDGDSVIDAKEIEVEEECLKILALHQPVAQDLRFVVAVLKVNNDLERMADLAQNIAQRTMALVPSQDAAMPTELKEMTTQVRAMVSRSLDALVRLDSAAARDLLRADESVDRLHEQMYRWFQNQVVASTDRVEAWIHLLSISRYLERIADLSTNIAEDIIFTVEGEVVRHGWEE
ncbi:MAG: phosphate transport system regulatory protein PhoU [Gemmatimonadota bacterium]|nr:MAG: phosphate transport system regulatory protein PhoU [Gemmatimonadota bacterium]